MEKNRLGTIIITGGTGYIGSHLASRLAMDNSVIVLARPGSKIRLPPQALGSVSIEYVEPDFRNVDEIVGRVKPDLVLHLASQITAVESPDGLTSSIHANITYPAVLVAAMKKHDVHALVNFGSSWQTAYGAHYSPFNFYSVTKQCCEDVIEYFAQSDLSAVTLRLFDTYGPNDWRNKVLNYMLAAVAEQRVAELSPGHQRIHLVHVDDIARAARVAASLALAGPPRHQVYSARSEEAISLRELARTIEDVAGRPLLANWGARDYRPGEIMEPTTAVPVLPGWTPKVSLPTGIAQCYSALIG
jgi:nucleoside-diphosphate-sugar epimerase